MSLLFILRLHLLCFFLILLNDLVFCYKLPKDFVWGVATASYQIEGAWNTSGKGPSIWDSFSHIPGRIHKGQSGDLADDFYHRYSEDIALMKQLGIKHFRMSLSWPRILPKGTVNLETLEGVNPDGVKFYNNVFDTLLAAGIEPWVTLYHWDLPLALSDKSSTGGWLNPNIVHRFNEYAEFCFKTFGDKVKKWLTFNEILVFSRNGYGLGTNAPGRCSPKFGKWCKNVGGGGDSGTEPYIVTHHALISHALAVQTYRMKYQKVQNGLIGMTMNTKFAEPFDANNPKDVKSVETAVLFMLGWNLDPLVFGKYPEVMTKLISGNRLPAFNESMSELIKGSLDFIGINHYTTKYVQYTGQEGDNWFNDGQYKESDRDAHGHLIGPYAGAKWINVYPQGLRKLLKFIKDRYGDYPIYIFENGVVCPNESALPLEQALEDNFRIDYLKGYTSNMFMAMIVDKVNVKGYFSWSLIDNFEWNDGYDKRFGMVYIDYNDDLKRYLKKSAKWYSLMSNTLTEYEVEDFADVDNKKLIQE